MQIQFYEHIKYSQGVKAHYNGLEIIVESTYESPNVVNFKCSETIAQIEKKLNGVKS